MGRLIKLLVAASFATLSVASPVGLDPQALEPATRMWISDTEAGGASGRDQTASFGKIEHRAHTTDTSVEVDGKGSIPAPLRERPRAAAAPRDLVPEPQQAAACTSTLTPISRYPCVTEGYETVYPSTKTAFAQVDCGRCLDLFIPRQVYFCPLRRILGIRTVNEPSTSWSTVCAGRTTRVVGRGNPTPAAVVATPTVATAAVAVDGSGQEEHEVLARQEACRTTRVMQPQRTAGPVATHYERTATETMRLKCGGCQLRLSTAVGGYGPVVRFTTTTTVPVETSTVFICQ